MAASSRPLLAARCCRYFVSSRIMPSQLGGGAELCREMNFVRKFFPRITRWQRIELIERLRPIARFKSFKGIFRMPPPAPAEKDRWWNDFTDIDGGREANGKHFGNSPKRGQTFRGHGGSHDRGGRRIHKDLGMHSAGQRFEPRGEIYDRSKDGDLHLVGGADLAGDGRGRWRRQCRRENRRPRPSRNCATNTERCTASAKLGVLAVRLASPKSPWPRRRESRR